jgi:hypothetical protein
MQKKVKIDVYLIPKHKEEIKKKADALGLNLSEYMRLKALDMLKEKNE